MLDRTQKIYVAGHRGLVGHALVDALNQAGFSNVVVRTSSEVDLSDAVQVEKFFETEKPDIVYLAAAKVGGIVANNLKPAEFIKDNLAIQTNVIDAAHRFGVQKLLFLGSSCIYPKFAEQPISEDALLTGALEPTNAPYAIAKIAGIAMCEAYRRQYDFNSICVMPTNLYGPHDNFDLETSHVFAAFIRRFHEAKVAQAASVTLWGTGQVFREFLHCADLAAACLHLMDHYNSSDIVNIGTGLDLTISELAVQIAHVVGFNGNILYDTSKPDGTPKKQLNITKIKKLGWAPKIKLVDGIAATYRWFLEHEANKKS